MIGLFGIGEILLTIEEGLAFRGAKAQASTCSVVLETWKELPRYWLTSLRSSLVGCLMGIVPGRRHAGVVHELRRGASSSRATATSSAPARSKAWSRRRPRRTPPAPRALLPMLTLGVPGSPTAAVLLGGLMIWGLQPGPLLFIEQKDFVWGLIASMYLGNIVGLIVVLTCVPLFAAILRVPFSIIAPIIIVICAIGAYTVHNAMFDVWMMLVFGVARLRVQEARLPARAAGAGARARRQAPRTRSASRCWSRRATLRSSSSNTLVGSHHRRWR